MNENGDVDVDVDVDITGYEVIGTEIGRSDDKPRLSGCGSGKSRRKVERIKRGKKVTKLLIKSL